jgi:hypothetical protein
MGEAARKLETLVPEPKDHPLTLLDLVAALAEVAESDAEVVAAVTRLINSGRVTLVGNFQGADVRIG